MKVTEALGIVMVVILVIAALLGLTWIVQGNDFFLYKTFAPKYEDARRETFEHSKAYIQGTVQELQNMQFEYVKAEEKHKDALASLILRRATNIDAQELPVDLRSFIEELRREQLGTKY